MHFRPVCTLQTCQCPLTISNSTMQYTIYLDIAFLRPFIPQIPTWFVSGTSTSIGGKTWRFCQHPCVMYALRGLVLNTCAIEIMYRIGRRLLWLIHQLLGSTSTRYQHCINTSTHCSQHTCSANQRRNQSDWLNRYWWWFDQQIILEVICQVWGFEKHWLLSCPIASSSLDGCMCACNHGQCCVFFLC